MLLSINMKLGQGVKHRLINVRGYVSAIIMQVDGNIRILLQPTINIGGHLAEHFEDDAAMYVAIDDDEKSIETVEPEESRFNLAETLEDVITGYRGIVTDSDSQPVVQWLSEAVLIHAKKQYKVELSKRDPTGGPRTAAFKLAYAR